MLTKLQGIYEYIYPLDPAVDHTQWDAKVRKEYFINNYNNPPIKDGETPTVWSLQPLKGKDVRVINDRIKMTDYQTVMGDTENVYFILARSITAIKNLDIEGFQIERDDSGNITFDCLDNLFPFFPVLGIEIAAIILNLSRLQVG